MVDYNFSFLKVAIVILAVVAVVAADLYGAAPAYKPVAYSVPATYSAPAYKQEYAVSQLIDSLITNCQFRIK